MCKSSNNTDQKTLIKSRTKKDPINNACCKENSRRSKNIKKIDLNVSSIIVNKGLKYKSQ